MDKKFIETCEKIFEERNAVKISVRNCKRYEKLTGIRISEEYLYILENFAGVFLKEEYRCKGLEKSPFADKQGYVSFDDFIPLSGKNGFFDTYKVYKQQLPSGYYPIARAGGGNLICVHGKTGNLYVWLHDEDEDECLFLLQKSLIDLMNSFEMVEVKKEDLSHVWMSLRPDFWGDPKK